MKLKFINLLLAAFLLIGSAQALTSCKDTDEDLYAQIRDEFTLKEDFDKEIKELNEKIKDLEKVDSVLSGKLKSLKDTLQNFATKSDLNNYVLQSEFQNKVDSVIAVQGLYQNLDAVLNALKATQNEVTNAHGDYATIGERFVAIEDALALLQQTLTNYDDLVSDVSTLTDFMESANTQLGNMSADISSLQTSVTSLNTFMDNWSPKLGGIEQNAAEALALAQKNEADIKALTLTYQQLQQMVNDNQAATDAQIAALQGTVSDLDTKLQGILDDYMTSADVDQKITDAISGLATTEALETLAAALRQEAQENLDAVELRLQQQINTCISRLNGMDTKIADIEADIKALQNELDDVKTAVKINKHRIDVLKKRLDSVIVRIFNLENRVSGIIIQGTVNPVLGYLNTPFGIQSNFLMNYMGTNDNQVAVSIPNYEDDGIEYNGELVITAADYALLKECGITGAVSFAPDATLINGYEVGNKTYGDLGKIYLTINPANINLDGKNFTIVNSQDKEIPVKLINLRPSNEELTFGYSRTETSANGFYEADAAVEPGDVPALRVVVDQQLKEAAKKVLKDLKNRKASASALLGLGNAVYNQFNGFLPALGICAAWDEEISKDASQPGKTEVVKQKVYSQYGLGAATFNPLSYKFLYDKSFRHIHLPDISGFLDKYKFNFTDQGFNITFDPVHIDGVTVDFSISLNPQIGDLDLGTISTTTTVKIEDFPIGFDKKKQELITETKYIDVPVNINLNETNLAANLSGAIEDAIKSSLDGLDDQIKSQFQGTIDSVISQIDGQISNLMTSLQTQVNDKLGTILENLQNQVNGKIDMVSNQITNNALYRKLEALVDKINEVLDNPNHYLQPVLLYSKQGQSYGMFSQSKGLPTIFVGEGNAVMLTPTTYTGEIVTPAFKKFVAVTNVWKTDEPAKTAQAKDSKCLELVKAANAQPYMNEVVSGERRTIPFYFEGGKGYTYEIVYQALDYSGVTSTSKYYVIIK